MHGRLRFCAGLCSITSAALQRLAISGKLAVSPPSKGKVYLVGAGPGAASLITLRGAECLREADCVFYDYLVNPRILSHARAASEQVCLGKHGRTRIWTQEEINAAVVNRAQEGKVVVRLKAGDPTVFGRSAEELEELSKHDIPYEIVPGVTAGLAVSSYAGIPLTHRKWASAVALVTGHEVGDKQESNLDYDALARFPGTLIFYMGVTTVGHWSTRLLAAGMDRETPVAAIRRCSFPDQQVILCKLGELSEGIIERMKLRPPMLFVIGRVATLEPALAWFSKRPLFGRTVLVARPVEQSSELADPLEQLGAQVLLQPAIEIGPPADWAPVDRVLPKLAEFQWIVFSSSNGVQYFLERLLSQQLDARAFASAKLAAIGPGTAAALRRYALSADLVPQEFRAEGLATALAPHVPGQRVLLIRASRGREVLADELRRAGAQVEQVVAYSSTDVGAPDPDIAEKLVDGRIDFVAATSSAIARSLVRIFGDALRHSQLVSISPITSETLRKLGHTPANEAITYTMPGVVDAILSAARSSASA